MDYIKEVEKFHKTFNVEISNCKEDIDLKVRQLRIKLLFEELHELAIASDVKFTWGSLCSNVINNEDKYIEDGNNVDKIEEIDGLSDLMYVLSGTILSLGYQDIFNESFKEVQRSNMSKSCSSIDEAEKTISFYQEKDGTESYYKEINGKYIVYRRSDDKVLKSINYSPADLKSIFNKF